jgi:hypothetical protein
MAERHKQLGTAEQPVRRWVLPLPLNVVLTGRLHHVEANHGVVVEDDRVVGLDESHAAHVCCQVEDMITAITYLLAVLKHPEIHKVELIAKHLLLQAANRKLNSLEGGEGEDF